MRKYVILAVILMIVTLSYFYFQLGGVSDIKKSVERVGEYQILVKPYKGKYNGKGLESIFFEAKELSDHMVIINYPLKGDSTENGYINQLIGARITQVSGGFPNGFTHQKISSSQVVRATIDAHNLVMPKPIDIETALREYAQEQNLELANYTIEQYLSDRELVVEIPIVE